MKRHAAKTAETAKDIKAHNTAQLRKAESTPFFFSFVMLWQGMMLLLQRILLADEASASLAYCLAVSNATVARLLPPHYSSKVRPAPATKNHPPV